MNEKEFADRTRNPADWVVQMRKYYEAHGFYRAQDLKRLLGDPCVGVSCDETRERWAA